MLDKFNSILIDNETEQKIKNNAPDKMPLNPTAQGWSAQMIRSFLAKSIVGNDGSILSVLKEKLLVIKNLFEGTTTDFIELQETVGSLDELSTEEKTSIVNAINEIVERINLYEVNYENIENNFQEKLDLLNEKHDTDVSNLVTEIVNTNTNLTNAMTTMFMSLDAKHDNNYNSLMALFNDINNTLMALEAMVIENHENRIIAVEGVSQTSFQDVTYNATTGELTFKRKNDETIVIDLPLELIISSGYLDNENETIVLVLANGGFIEIPLELIYRKIDDIVNKHEQDIQTINLTLSDIIDDVDNLFSNVAFLEAENVSKDTQLSNHENRISNLETDNATNKTNITNLTNKTNNHEDRIYDVEIKSIDNAQEISNLKQDVDNHENRISNLETDNIENRDNINNLLERVEETFTVEEKQKLSEIPAPLEILTKTLARMSEVYQPLHDLDLTTRKWVLERIEAATGVDLSIFLEKTEYLQDKQQFEQTLQDINEQLHTPIFVEKVFSEPINLLENTFDTIGEIKEVRGKTEVINEQLVHVLNPLVKTQKDEEISQTKFFTELKQWDTIKVINGDYKKEVGSGEVVFDGSESGWFYVPSWLTDNTVSFSTFISDNKNSHNVISNIFGVKKVNEMSDEEGNIAGGIRQNYAIKINKSRLNGYSDELTNTEKVNLFKQWLQDLANEGKPLTVCYELAVKNPIKINLWEFDGNILNLTGGLVNVYRFSLVDFKTKYNLAIEQPNVVVTGFTYSGYSTDERGLHYNATNNHIYLKIEKPLIDSQNGENLREKLINYLTVNNTTGYFQLAIGEYIDYERGELDFSHGNTLFIHSDTNVIPTVVANVAVTISAQVKSLIDNTSNQLTNNTSRIETLEDDVQQLTLDIKNTMVDVTYNGSNGHLTFDFFDGTKKTIDLPLELLIESGYYDETNKNIVLVLANEQTIEIPIEDILTEFENEISRLDNDISNLDSEIEDLKNYDIQNLNNLVQELKNKVDDLENRLYTDQIGTIVWRATSTVPKGWMLCNGAALSRTKYSKLYQVIGTTFGSGDGSTTFNLPDLINEELFIRAGREVDLGIVQLDQNKEHTHNATSAQGGSHYHQLSTNEITLADNTDSDYRATGYTDSSIGTRAYMTIINNIATRALNENGYVIGNTSTASYLQASSSTKVPAQSTGEYTAWYSAVHTKFVRQSIYSPSHNHTTIAAGEHQHDITIQSSGSSETRPKNITLIPLIFTGVFD